MSSLIWSLVGASLAAAFFGALARSVRRLLAEGATARALLLHAGRWLLLLSALTAIARLHGRALLPVVAGFALVQAVACMVARAYPGPTEDRRA
ncbi:N-ATPase subunit AtpR [Sorangium sp. So ce124]|uniref:N-ATPase subunit AtpR n=1 Tax=Sorangium sp. So ce124 TaxID=3133280 RepID=UPI003F6282C7